MNTWNINWDLTIKKDEVIKLLHEIIQSYEKPPSKQKKLKGKIVGNRFEVIIKRSLIWGTAFRKEIQGQGSVVENQKGSCLEASFEVCAPFRYVNFNGRKLSIIIPIFIFSWIGLLVTGFRLESLLFLNYLLIPAFVVTCIILLIGFQRYLTIDDKFKEVMKAFERTFEEHRIKGS
jgi:hypothetical protein